jgi:flagellar biosynthesis/type III secretory pathway protein FliH
VSYSPKSEFSKEKFDEKLNTMQEDYIEEQREYEEAYAYEEGYRTGYSQGSLSHRNNHDDYFAYYLFYTLGQRSRY